MGVAIHVVVISAMPATFEHIGAKGRQTGARYDDEAKTNRVMSCRGFTSLRFMTTASTCFPTDFFVILLIVRPYLVFFFSCFCHFLLCPMSQFATGLLHQGPPARPPRTGPAVYAAAGAFAAAAAAALQRRGPKLAPSSQVGTPQKAVVVQNCCPKIIRRFVTNLVFVWGLNKFSMV